MLFSCAGEWKLHIFFGLVWNCEGRILAFVFKACILVQQTNKQTNKIFCETVPVNQSSVSFLIGISMTINRTEDIRSVRQAFIAPHPLLYCSLIVMKKLSTEVISNAMYKALYQMAHVTRVIKLDYVVFLETQMKMKPVPSRA